ncbi:MULTISPECIES: hypothetical protein [unclassified Bradyrhizobium]|uniref:hypothetical protein n=1 Tax=unclassified Bradyrhizobium TaxID=2631580 RepID=UPI002479EBA8|nr:MULTISPECIES: hypothetical protein [unclassified Bradyrhizobium]WGR69685.1 hypothetical protein MTX24_30415 [Bradyrhizobium sp. ISRA426]WGR81742.1 hypothetical protein MTX21_15525 [Bradyrhizobium sp. ISRA430]WGR84927.1 hypothetical protein MTX25_30090 [Bradyrhizobium sp. ISRA432]
MDFSLSELLTQNTPGNSEGFPAGVPPSFNWYQGWNDGGLWSPPADFSAVEGWGQVYPKVGAPPYSNPNAAIEVANAKTYVRLKQSGEWTLVQDQAKVQLTGGHFVSDFAGNVAIPMRATSLPGATISFDAPPVGYNNHFWYKARGVYPAGTVDAVYVQMEMRVTDPNLHLVAMVGADWWRHATAPYLDDHSNNPGVGGSNWTTLSTEWKTIGFYSTSAEEFRAGPAPPLRGSAPKMQPPNAPSSPPTPPRSDYNLMRGGSFEPTPGSDEGSIAIGNDGSHQTGKGHQRMDAGSGPAAPARPITVTDAFSNDSLVILALALGALVKIRREGPSVRARRRWSDPL